MSNTNIIPPDTSKIYTHSINAPWLSLKNLTLDVLRLDAVHEVISGNKWFKLKYYLEDARINNKSTIATFGGAWSNHIAATAYAAKSEGFNSVGVIRGERPAKLSATIEEALTLGMILIFVSREEYRSKEQIIKNYEHEDWYWIQEGGYGDCGASGIKQMLEAFDLNKYKYIVTAVGTGTTLAGLVHSSNKHQQCIGISSMKSNQALQEQVNRLLPKHLHNQFKIEHDYHFGGYAKHPKILIDFINKTYKAYQLPLDMIYTGKTFYAIQEMAKNNVFEKDSSILMIHTGGLQGNKSLADEVLAF